MYWIAVSHGTVMRQFVFENKIPHCGVLEMDFYKGTQWEGSQRSIRKRSIRMAWTTAQQKVIDTRNKNLLVSAAAGSGKTAVLVERIICMITEGEKPMDIDRLLVVTFTNAAAAEMRERIGNAIDKKLAKEPANQHLQKQVSLLQSAQITTIHSFCLNVIRNYFHRIDLDPSFKIADDSETTLMKSDVISDLLEHWYEEGREDFLTFIESYSYSKSDAPIEDLVLQLYTFSMSDPWPESWIADKKKMFLLDSTEDMYKTPWMKELASYVDNVLSDLLEKVRKAAALCSEPDGPSAYLPALLWDRSMLEQLRNADTYEEQSKLFSGISFDRLSNKKEEGVQQWKKDKVKELRDEVKKGLKDLVNQFFFQSPEEMLKDMQAANRVMQVLFDLTLEFMEAFAHRKEEKNLIDFNDLEHYALKILVNEDEDRSPTQAALELSELFEEILIDEYQDSNMVQETILKSISREDMGRPNRFMVGDVKQSIYKFRLAMPEIFMEKYGSYKNEECDATGQINLYQRIDLDKNFRSRRQVIDYVNIIFEQIMQRSVGGIIYDETAALKYGELYDAAISACDVDFLLVIDNEEDDSSDSKSKDTAEAAEAAGMSTDAAVAAGIAKNSPGKADKAAQSVEAAEESDYTKKEIEARMIVRKIRELTDPMKGMLIMDKNTRTLRPVSCGDIVILLRSMSGWSEAFVNTLMQEGIPAYADTGTGYFQTLEIMTIINMLRIIDNPRQDIPLTGVLYSPMVGVTATELALIRAGNRKVSMYSAVISYIEKGGDEELRAKLEQFMAQLREYRYIVNHTPIHELIQLVLDRTGYYYYVSAMPAGDQRRANVDMLISQAVRFEKGSYSGLFHFIRYIERLHKYEVDFGEASTSGEKDDTVRIMSIHKSKGLEFPVVFVAGMSKQFNTQDIRNNIILHSELGAGPEYIDSKARTKVPTLLKKFIQKKVQIENLGEELRVLYVAMTRAREKLILTGYLKDLEELKRKEFSFFELLSAKSYTNWVLPAMMNKIEEKPYIDQLPYEIKGNGMAICIISQADLIRQEAVKQLFMRKDKETLQSIDPDQTYNAMLKEEIKSRLEYKYPYGNEAALKIKMTVSELKKLGQFQDEEYSVRLYMPETEKDSRLADAAAHLPIKDEADYFAGFDPITDEISEITPVIPEITPTIPGFIRQTQAMTTGTDRGTLYHKVLELLDLNRVSRQEDILAELDRMASINRINPEDIKKLKLDYLYHFTRSKVADRMRKARSLNLLYKEKQFVMGIKASEVLKGVESEELILIQGIIDVFFEEDGELVLLDYKSDLVKQESELIHRYRMQLHYYKKALEQMLQKRVKEMIIYSLPLGKEIRIDQ